jgi:hypothetical protein
MILVAQHHAGSAFHVSVEPERIVAQIIPDAVGFDIGLIDQVNAIFIAQVVPGGVIGIMTGAHGIEVQLLHQDDFSAHVIVREGPAAFGMMLMAIHAA